MRFLSLLVSALALPAAFGIRLLNDPAELVQNRFEILENIQDKLKTVEKANLIKNEGTIKKVLDSIGGVLAEFKKKQKDVAGAKKDKKAKGQALVDSLDKAIKAIRNDVTKLQKELIARAKELEEKQRNALADHKAASKKRGSEEAFDKLMDGQDLPVDEQEKILVKFEDSVPAAKALLAKKLPEGANLAFEFGKMLDDEKWEKKKREKKDELVALEAKAHINEKQATKLLPILKNLKRQKTDKVSKLQLIGYNIRKLDNAERNLKKERGRIAKETHALDRAISSIEAGDAKKVGEAMKELKNVEAFF